LSQTVSPRLLDNKRGFPANVVGLISASGAAVSGVAAFLWYSGGGRPYRGILRGDPSEGGVEQRSAMVVVAVFIAFSEGFSATTIFAFCSKMTEELMGSAATIGYHAGLLYTANYAGMLLSTYPWARASDMKGRRFCLLIGTFSCTMCNLLATMVHEYWMMVTLRFICGLLNANNTVVRTSLREVFSHDCADDTKAFSYVSVSYAASSLLGPWLGGVMYGQGFLMTWSGQTPWALPLCIVTLLNAICFLAVLVLQPETAFLAPESQSPKTTSLLKDKRFLLVLLTAWGHSYVFTGWETVYPTFAGVSGASGGEEWSPARVGGTFLAGGIALIAYNLWMYPWLVSKFTVVRVWIWSWMPPLVMLAVFPRVLTHLMAEHVDPEGVGVLSLNYSAQVVISVCMGSGFTSIQLIMNRHVASLSDGPAQLASAIGSLATAQALARALSPATCGALFSASFNVSFLSQAAAFDLLALTAGCLTALSAALLWV